MPRIRSGIVVLLTCMALIAGCGSGGAKDSSQSTKAGDATVATESQAAPEAAAPGNGSAEGLNADRVAAATQTLPLQDRKVILNAQVDLKVKEADGAVREISEAVRAAGGYVQENRQDGTQQQGRKVNLIVRVPSGAYGSIFELVNRLGEVTTSREWTNDVTEEYVDLDARIKTKETHLSQLQKLYAKGGSIKELMDLEQEIARVTAELESIKGRFQFLSSQVAFSTITVTLYEPGVPAPIQPPKTVWDRMKLGFATSWHGLVNWTGDLVVFLATAIPVLAAGTILGGGGYGIYRAVRKRRQQPPAA